MLDENDIHRLAGHLYMATRCDDMELVLGERLPDAASGTDRDVDVVVLSSAHTGLMGAEVKDHARPLDVTMVEQLCQKLNDMPSLTERQIVSRSGFTTSARTKAAAHGVTCLTMDEGPLPNFAHVDLSNLQEVHVMSRAWVEAEILLLPEAGADEVAVKTIQTPDADQNMLVRVGSQAIRLHEVTRRILKGTLDRVPPQDEPGLVPVNSIFNLDVPVGVEVNATKILFPRVSVVGTITLTLTSLPLNRALYLRDSAGMPLSACVLAEIKGDLVGLSAAEGVGRLNLIRIPKIVRDRRPHYESIRRSAPGTEA